MDVQTVESACPVCQETNGEHVYTRRQYRTGDLTHFGLRRCSACKHVYLSPRPTDGTLGSYYGEGYYTVANANAQTARVTEHALRYSRYVGRLVGNTPGTLLDVGCGDGEFLALMASKGWKCHGVERDERTGSLVRSKPGILSVRESLQDFDNEKFDCITMFEVVEHLTDPLSDLQTCRRLLSPDGRLLVKTPNFNSLERVSLGPNWISLEIPRHLQFFTERTLGKCLRSAGLEPTMIFQPWNEEAFTRSIWLMLTNAGKLAASSTAAFTPSSWRRQANRYVSALLSPLCYAASLLRVGHTIMMVAVRNDLGEA